MTDRFKSEDDSRAEAELRANVDAAAGKFGLTAEGRDKMLERMKSSQSLDAEASAAWVAAQQPKPSAGKESNWLPSKMGLGDVGVAETDWAAWDKDPIGHADSVIANILNEAA